jgi:hypothetical protein
MAKTIGKRHCLIIERHEWETGAARHQLSLPVGAQQFFQAGSASRAISVRLAHAKGTIYSCSISRKYTKTGPVRASESVRINQLPVIGLLGHCFMFFQETSKPNLYDLWCNYDLAIVAASFGGWEQGVFAKRGRRGHRGRLYTIVSTPVGSKELLRVVSPPQV